MRVPRGQLLGRSRRSAASPPLVALLLLTTAAAFTGAKGPGLHPSQAQRPAAKSVSTKPTFDELYKRGQQINAGIRTLTARFTETTSSSLLLETRPNVTHGTLYVQRPSRVALHYRDPEGRVIIDGDRMVTSWPSRNVGTSMDIGATQKQVQKYFVDSDAAELKRVFDIQLRDGSERAGTREVIMTPRRKQIREALTRLDLWVDESTALLKAMRMTFSNGETKLMEFEDVVPSASIDPVVFSVPK
jgi:outer membrane lipoprotein-sorting protein